MTLSVPTSTTRNACSHRECDVGVVIPLYNRATVVLATLDSVARQTHLPKLVVIVDDGSTDGSQAAVARWIEARRPPFDTLLLQQQHQTAAAARDLGMAHLGDLPLVAFLDSDDVWPIDFLQRTVAALTANPAAIAASANRRFINVRGEHFRSDDCAELAHDPVNWLFRKGAGVASCTLLRSSAVRQVGGWEREREIGEDTVLFVKLGLMGQWLHTPGEAVTFFHGNAAACREEGNLSCRYADNRKRWADCYEMLYNTLSDNCSAENRAGLRRALAMCWYRAGRQLSREGDKIGAHHCFKRALHWHPTFLRAWKRRLTSRLSLVFA